MLRNIISLLLLINFSSLSVAKVISVTATHATPPAADRKDSMDDPAICLHPKVPSKSLIIGANKASNGGLYLYSLQGKQLGFIQDGAMNNVDIRPNFPYQGEKIHLVVASKRNHQSVGIYKLDFEKQTLINIAAPDINLSIDPYGLALYQSRETGKTYVFITTKKGYFHQYELIPTKKGRVDMVKVRSVSIGSQSEGIAADDQTGYLYVAEEDVGLWRYQADPQSGTKRISIAKVGDSLVDDVEGVTILKAGLRKGYIIVSSQGNDTYYVYDRKSPHAFRGGFQIVAGKGMEGTEATDGIDACGEDLGPDFKGGVFIAHDNRSSKGGGSNFKLVSWATIAKRLGL